MPTLTIDGKEITVEKGTTIIQAAEKLGIEIPRYCYHPGLSIAGNCRMCLVEIEKSPKLQISCYTQAADGMVVHTTSEKVKAARRAILEFLLINHPVDCPVCDQAGECWLQIYYMEHGLYNSRFMENKVRKHFKATPIGPWVNLDSERCILCSRCVRFTSEITKTYELALVNRGDHSEITIFPGKELNNKYSGNVVDICPVGALTDRDFRFQCRVWYLDKQESICPGCSRGCNIEIHYNVQRAHHAGGRRVLRIKPRFNPEVNKWWICDEGRYGYKFIDDKSRIQMPYLQEGEVLVETDWKVVLDKVASTLRSILTTYGTESIGVIASPQLTNEDLYLIRKLFVEDLRLPHVDFKVPVKEKGYEDDFLIKADKNPNTRGAEELGLGAREGSLNVENMLEAAGTGRLKALYVFGQDLTNFFGEEKIKEIASRLELLVFQGSNLNPTGQYAHVILPSATYAEKDGTFTNFEGRVQRIYKAVEPLGESLPDWEIIIKLARLMGFSYPYQSAREIFEEIATVIPAFNGLSYKVIGSQGAKLATV
ncbi:MAG TPA: molybdopterin-dependent oxidoreductase [Candidatus Limnocylindrales bacterium]|nr:molybdopterin-dependent oxidoreductase [Candidatus Limnocylindrales bacterium]